MGHLLKCRIHQIESPVASSRDFNAVYNTPSKRYICSPRLPLRKARGKYLVDFGHYYYDHAIHLTRWKSVYHKNVSSPSAIVLPAVVCDAPAFCKGDEFICVLCSVDLKETKDVSTHCRLQVSNTSGQEFSYVGETFNMSQLNSTQINQAFCSAEISIQDFSQGDYTFHMETGYFDIENQWTPLGLSHMTDPIRVIYPSIVGFKENGEKDLLSCIDGNKEDKMTIVCEAFSNPEPSFNIFINGAKQLIPINESQKEMVEEGHYVFSFKFSKVKGQFEFTCAINSSLDIVTSNSTTLVFYETPNSNLVPSLFFSQGSIISDNVTVVCSFSDTYTDVIDLDISCDDVIHHTTHKINASMSMTHLTRTSTHGHSHISCTCVATHVNGCYNASVSRVFSPTHLNHESTPKSSDSNVPTAKPLQKDVKDKLDLISIIVIGATVVIVIVMVAIIVVVRKNRSRRKEDCRNDTVTRRYTPSIIVVDNPDLYGQAGAFRPRQLIDLNRTSQTCTSSCDDIANDDL